MHADLPVPAAATFEFLQRQLGPTPRRVLEVGCGDGAVAAALARAGHEVLAIDADPEMVARARARGVDARCVRWPEFAGEGFDAVAFTRSLHHLVDLDAAVVRACQVLVPHGLVLVEDFDHAAVDKRTLRWFRRALVELDGDGHLRTDGKLCVRRLLDAGSNPSADDLLAAWRDEHAHDLHAFLAIEAAVAAVARPGFRAEVPYLYRYVADALVPGPDALAALGRLHREEDRCVRRAEIAVLGRRLVARTPLPA